MKILVSAIALSFAVPAAAQTAPVAQPPQDHSQHQQPGNSAPAGHSGHAGHQIPHGQHQGGEHGQHQGHAMGCCADRNNNGRMDCCEHMAGEHQAQPAQPAQPQAHDNH